jgi:hypothetical protein
MRAEILELAAAQGVEVTLEDLDRMNHPDMTSLLEAFKAQAETASDSGVAETAPEAPVDYTPPVPSADPPEAMPLNSPPTGKVDGTDDSVLGGPPANKRYRYPYTVAERCSVTTQKRGTRGAFDRVRADDFPGGQAQLDELVASGHVVKRP